MDQIDVAVLILRIWVGLVMVLHGVNHARSLEGTASWFASKGFKSAELNARLSAFAEIAMGLAIAVGFLTSFAVLGLVATMFVAFWSIHRFAGFFNFHRPDEGFEYVATLALIGTAIAIAGPHEASLDHLIGIDDALDGWVGALLAAGGLVVGFGQIAAFWRQPVKENNQ